MKIYKIHDKRYNGAANGVRSLWENGSVSLVVPQLSIDLFFVSCTVCTFQIGNEMDKHTIKYWEGRVSRQVQFSTASLARLYIRGRTLMSVCPKERWFENRYIYTTILGTDQKKLYSHNSSLYQSTLRQNCNGNYHMSAHLIFRRNSQVTPI